MTTPGDTRLGGIETLGRYSTYAAAQRRVDTLGDAGFPVHHVSILGDDLHIIQDGAGPRPKVRASLIGAAQGVWMGLVLLIIFVIFTPGTDWTEVGIVPIAGVAGAISGAGRLVFPHAGGGVASSREVRAATYAVVIDANYAERARRLLREALCDGPLRGPSDATDPDLTQT